MPDAPNLTASIQVLDPKDNPGDFRIGANPQPANRIQLSVKNLGAPVNRTAGKGNLYLRGTLGSSAEALFLDDTDARQCVRKFKDSADWKTDWDFSGKNQGRFRLKIYTFNATLFGKGQVLTLDLSQVLSKTLPGEAKLWFETDLAVGQQGLMFVKSVKRPDIISFYSIPAAEVKKLPRESVQLYWSTYGLDGLDLRQDGQSLQGDLSKETKEIIADQDTEFQLLGYDGSRRVDRNLKVSVLRTGWHDRSNTIVEGDPGYPSPQDEAGAKILEDNSKLVDGRLVKPSFDLEPTLLVGTEKPSVYGLFRHEFQGKERVLLFETMNPFSGWRLVPIAEPGKEVYAPEGFSSSPGVYFGSKIWLIGGSQIDPENTSNGVWYFDPNRSGPWENRGAAPWRRRMGHAVVEYRNKIWVMGGRDEAGNALNDVWTLDAAKDGSVWKQEAANAPWLPRCLFSPAVFNDQIWLYGGTKEPFSDILYDDLWTYDGRKWEEKKITKIIKGNKVSGKPIASSLQVFKDRRSNDDQLYLFGTFRTIDPSDKSEVIEQQALVLSEPSTGTWAVMSSDGLQKWGAATSFSYQAVKLGDKMLIARALAYEKPNPVLKVYVPT